MRRHQTIVKTSNGAGQRNHRAECQDCPWHGTTTSDRPSADQQAADHELSAARQVTR